VDRDSWAHLLFAWGRGVSGQETFEVLPQNAQGGLRDSNRPKFPVIDQPLNAGLTNPQAFGNLRFA
jgi:hypothetical protein